MQAKLVLMLSLAANASCTGTTITADESPRSEPTDRARNEGMHLLVVVRATLAPVIGVEIVSSVEVATPIPRERAPRSHADAWRVELLDATGNVLSTEEVASPNSVRGEFAGADGAMEAHHIERDVAELLVRFPIYADADGVRIWVPDASTRSRHELGRAALPRRGGR